MTAYRNYYFLSVIPFLMDMSSNYYSLRTSEIHLFYNLQVFYWHFLEILWLFIFLVLYSFDNLALNFCATFLLFQRNYSLSQESLCLDF